jgi:hypothetical protein
MARRLNGILLTAVIGNHGAEAAFGPLDRDVKRRVPEWSRPTSATM